MYMESKDENTLFYDFSWKLVHLKNHFKFSFFFFLTLTLFNSRSLSAGEVRIAVAANFTHVSREISKVFEDDTGHKVKVSYGSTGKLFAQIANGAPFDVFLSADTNRAIKAIDNGLAVANTHFVYAKGKLVLWSMKNDVVDEGESWFKRAAFKRVAIANPKTAPYGLAAQQVIERIGNWESVQHKLVRGDSIAQTFQFVATANTDAGFVAWSQVKAWQEKESSGSLWAVPENYYQPINQSAVLLKKGENNPVALAYLDFLKTDKARNIIYAFGYGIHSDDNNNDDANNKNKSENN